MQEMPDRVKFSKQDIGGEILPILTTGLYRNKLDTLREYVQNAIDARSRNIELAIDPDTIMVADDGVGMNFDEAKKAIRLGISEKSPLENVGFRGIGIYSAFNLCDTLDIYTRAAGESYCYLIHLDFKRIREALLKDQERKKQGKPSLLYLEKLLGEAVYVDLDRDGTVGGHGTKAIMSGLLGEVYQELNNWDKVVSYLQDVVPLPFRSDFKYSTLIQAKFEEEDYRVVPLTLQIGTERSPIFRPYYDGMFAHGGEHPPEFFEISQDRQRFGFAWVGINDARQVLKDTWLRGLLIKKYGFSISSRSFLEPYFPRPIFNRRITGEIIIKHSDLLPNAARSDFEPNLARQAFFQALPNFIRKLSVWANRIQEEDKSREVLAEVSQRLREINRELPAVRRDKETLLKLNVQLYYLERQIKSHAKILKQIMAQETQSAEVLLKECQQFVKSVLIEQRKAREAAEQHIVRSIQREAVPTPERETERLEDIPRNLAALIENYGLPAQGELLELLKIIDERYLQMWLSSDEYNEMLQSLREFLEERL
jgi:hypothetical protein